MSRIFGAAVVCTLLVSPFAVSSSAADPQSPDPHARHASSPPGGELAARVREATAFYRNINQAIADGYEQSGGCVSGPEIGAMGIHFVNGALVDDTLDPDHPEALIYEVKNGIARLVGVEFVTPMEAWDGSHEEPPTLNGQHLQFVSAPNRYRLPALYELHVWAWRENPNGTFVDWNPRVSCDGAE
jgi:hypothetical protein